MHLNRTFQEIKNSRNDVDIKRYREFSKAIGREELYVKDYLTWSQEHDLELPVKTTLSYDGVEDISPYKCCYFSIVEKHDYYLQDWSQDESRVIKLNLLDLIRV